MKLELYSKEELFEIVLRSSNLLKIKIEELGAIEIASRSRSTPRIANRLLKRVRDFSQVLAKGTITKKLAELALEKLGVDALGLDENDRRLLRSMIDFYRGGPVGVEAIAASINEEVITIEDVYEPYLMQIGFLTRTPRGRVVTERAYRHLGVNKK